MKAEVIHPFEKYDSTYLESLPDEVFFAKRFKLSEEDEAVLHENSSIVHGHRYYRTKVRTPIIERYAAMTNPKEGEPGSKTNPLVRFGKEYVYNHMGDLVPFHREVYVLLTSAMKPTKEQDQMIREAACKPIIYGKDCPKSSPERLKRFRDYGMRREQFRRRNQGQSFLKDDVVSVKTL